ncbi:formylglycine-generating enzyme family protein [Puniceicoccus vermicola]|uniref:Formylglycine-generating enzyme family protein n=1 Tax=Puniceicoccus vermicola TaxID=388746 RepID=A0A7X1E2Z3_9BACT|nr:formylglycine-generating enzyme family protein [Puniceicoccus vermicola]MBC2600531.1 formylglycine-generating enzyme family protein [Puniceicoccus vermicola]
MKTLLIAVFSILYICAVQAVFAERSKVIDVDLGEGRTMRFIRISPKSIGINYPDYFISETEVTNAQFKAFLDATKRQKDDRDVLKAIKKRKESGVFSTGDIPYSVEDEKTIWRDGKFPKGLEEHPVALVTLPEVTDFCTWLSDAQKSEGLFRLPSWNEWMISAYGRSREYPWGDDWDSIKVHMSFGFKWNKFPTRTEPVKARPQGRSPEGIYGLLGNVSEYILTGDPTNESYFNLGSRSMGGGFSDGKYTEKGEGIAPRQDYWGYSHHATPRECDLGFRVVLDPTNNAELPNRTRLFQQNDRSWMITPQTEKTEKGGGANSEATPLRDTP